MNIEKLLGLDFDGVLHPSADSVHFNPNPNMPMWQVELAMKTQGRFVWLDKLEEALRGTDVRIAVHSTWRRRFSDQDIKHLLGTELGARLVVLDGHIENRETSTADEYMVAVLECLSPNEVLVIDDRPEFFATGGVSRWIHEHAGAFIWTDPDQGISDPATYSALVAWAHSPVEGCACVHGADFAPAN